MSQVFTKMTVAQQVARKLRRQIEEGDLKPGQALPSLRTLAGRYKVSLNTARKAMQELSSLDLVDCQSRRVGMVKSTVIATSQKRPSQVAWISGIDPACRPSYWSQHILMGAQAALAEAGYRISLFTYSTDKPDWLAQVRQAMEPVREQLAGVITAVQPELNPLFSWLDEMKLPWMTYSPRSLEAKYNFAAADHVKGGRLVGRCFVRLGYRKILILAMLTQNASYVEKITGLYQAYLERGLATTEIELLQTENQDEDAAFDLVERYLKTHKPPQAIFTMGDWQAVGAMRACQGAGLRVGEDVGVVGSTGLPPEQLLVQPSLTVLSQPMERIGRQTAAGLLEMIRGGMARIAGRRVPCSLIFRDSLAAPPALRQAFEEGGAADDDAARAEIEVRS